MMLALLRQQKSTPSKVWRPRIKDAFLTVLNSPHFRGLTAQLRKSNKRGVLVC